MLRGIMSGYFSNTLYIISTARFLVLGREWLSMARMSRARSRAISVVMICESPSSAVATSAGLGEAISCERKSS